jgi:hypothetical protein
VQLTCPKCGSRDARVARRKQFAEWLRGLVGVFPLRCRRCQTRWETSMWEAGAWRYARCPRCYRQDLTTWSDQFYNAPGPVRLKLGLGAKRYRCGACRYNFAGFKKRKQVAPAPPPQDAGYGSKLAAGPDVENLPD